MRKMATIRRISAIHPIPNADAIEVASVDGWKVVVKRGEFTVNDLAVYAEVDSWIPHAIAPFLSKGKEPREFNGVPGERLRTIRLRGQISQGLLLSRFTVLDRIGEISEGQDVSELLGIQKWEAPVPAQLAGQVRGVFPTQIPKTDQERCQNLVGEITAARGKFFEVTEKLEGSSMTCYLIDGEFGVCSRNLDLKRDEDNAFWRVAIEQNIESSMRDMGDNFAIQGELVGPGIQGNIYKLSKPEFYIYDMYDVVRGCYVNPADRRASIEQFGLKHVPVINKSVPLNHSVGELLEFADGRSQLNFETLREGLVYKQVDGEFSFKTVSNLYLLGEKS